MRGKGFHATTAILVLTMIVVLVLVAVVHMRGRPAGEIAAGIGRAFFLKLGAGGDAEPGQLKAFGQLLMFVAWLCVAIVGTAYGRKKISCLVLLPPLTIAGLNYMGGVESDTRVSIPGP